MSVSRGAKWGANGHALLRTPTNGYGQLALVSRSRTDVYGRLRTYGFPMTRRGSGVQFPHGPPKSRISTTPINCWPTCGGILDSRNDDYPNTAQMTSRMLNLCVTPGCQARARSRID
jgi:hypothetical protein